LKHDYEMPMAGRIMEMGIGIQRREKKCAR